MYGADPRLCRSAPRPAAGGCSPRSASRTRSVWRTCAPSTRWPTRSSACAPSARRWTASSSSSTRASRAQGNAVVRLTGPAGRRAPPTSGPPCMERLREMELESPDDAARRLPGQVRRGGGHRRGADRRARSFAARASSCGCCPTARWSCSPPTTSCWAAPAGRATSAAASRRRRVRPRDHRARRDDRSPAGTQGALGPLRGRLRGRARRWRRVGVVRDRAQPAQGRDDPPVPHAAVPHRRPLRPGDRVVPHAAGTREAPGRHRPPRVRAAARADAVRPVRHRGAARPALRPVAPGRAWCST